MAGREFRVWCVDMRKGLSLDLCPWVSLSLPSNQLSSVLPEALPLCIFLFEYHMVEGIVSIL